MRLSVAQLLIEAAQRWPRQTALIAGEKKITYIELSQRAGGWAHELAARGVRENDRVAVMMPNTVDFPAVYYATLALGATVVPVHPLLTAREVGYILTDTDARLLVAAESVRETARAAAATAGTESLLVPPPDAEFADTTAAPRPLTMLADSDAGDLAVVLYTSGTTGHPKGAMLTHGNLLLNALITAQDVANLQSQDVLLGCLPLFHAFGQTVVMNAACRAGAAVVLMDRFDGAEALDLIDRHHVTVFTGVPTMYVSVLDAASSDPRRPSLRLAISGGAALPATVIERFTEVFGGAIYEGYGLSETSPVVTFNQSVYGRRPGTIGHPIWGVEVEIARADVEGRIEILGPDEVGELVVRGHAVFAGYLNDPDATAAAIVDGWFRTGDLGTKDSEGFIRIVDRKKDLIVRGGYNIYPREIEEVLNRHPAIAQAAVVGLPDEHYGEEIHAAVVLRDGVTARPTEIVAWSREHLARHKYPRHVHIVERFPLGPSGKVLKRELAADIEVRR